MKKRILATLFVACMSFSFAHMTYANTLKDTVAAALRYNPRIKMYREGYEAAEQNLHVANSGWFPKLDINASVGGMMYEDPTTRAEARKRVARKQQTMKRSDQIYLTDGAGVSLKQEIFTGLSTLSSSRAAKARIRSADYRLIDNTEAIALDAILAHINVVAYTKIVALAQNNVKQHERILLSQTQRRNLGAGNVADVSQTQSRLARAKATLSENINKYRDAVARYTAVTGVPVPSRGLTDVPALSAAFSSYESALASTRSSNPKINALLNDVEALENDADVARSAFMPAIYAEAAFNYGYQTGTIANNDMLNLSLMLRMDWNLFNGMRDYGTMKAALAEARKTRYEVLYNIDLLAEETKQTWNRYLATKEESTFYATAKKFAQSSRDAYLQQFQVGQRSLLDVLDAENELFSVSVLEVSSKADIVATQYRILALGGKLLPHLGIESKNLKNTPLPR